MATPYQVPIEAFYRRIEKDKEYFNYFGLTSEEAMELARERAAGYLNEATGMLVLKCVPDVDFNDRDDLVQEFNFDWTNAEVFLISSLMYEMYLDRDIAKLKCLMVNYTPTDLRVFDPSNARNSFLEMYDKVCNKNIQLIDDYASRDRLTGKLKGIDYASYDEEDD